MLRQAVFLVGGLGTRLKETTRATPKPLIAVGGRPFIDYLIDEAARHGFTDIVLLAGHLGGQFESQYNGLKRHGAIVRVVTEPEPLGTGGAVHFALPVLDDVFLLGNGDSFFDVNLLALPRPDPGSMTMALRATAPGSRYGTVRVKDGRVRRFHGPHDGVAGPINAGVYLMSREIVASFPDGKSSIENDHFPRLAEVGRIHAAVFDGFFIDMGVPQDLARSQSEMPAHTRRPAVFFDRDGVLNGDHGYVHRSGQFDWLLGAKAAIRLCNDRGWFAFVVTNQAGVAHGFYTEPAIKDLHGWISDELACDGAHVDAFEYCPHHPEGKVAQYTRDCRRRKPEPGMIADILADWPVDVRRSLLIGDKQSDVDAANAAGIAGHLFTGGNVADFVAARMAG